MCASKRYAFLSKWLPVEERRRRRRSRDWPATATERRMMPIRKFFAGLFGNDEFGRPSGPPRTRASDHVPQFDLQPPAQPSTAVCPATQPRPLKGDVR